MKKIYTLLLFISSPLLLMAQTPQGFYYQASARDRNGDLFADKQISVEIEIRNGAPTGSAAYTETHTVTTNEVGIFQLSVGEGTSTSGNFVDIDWSSESKYMAVSIDLDAGSNFVEVGVQQLFSVPYSLYAENVANKDDADADPENELELPDQEGNAGKILTTDGTNVSWSENGDTDATNEIQGAQEVDYDNTASKMMATNVQTAIDELDETIDNLDVEDGDSDPENELELPDQTDQGGKILTTDGTSVSWTTNGDGDSQNEIQSAEEVN